MVAEFAGDLREGDLAPASTARIVVAVRSLHRFAVDDGITTSDPAREVAPPKAGRRLPKALSLAEVQAMLETPLVDDPRSDCGTPPCWSCCTGPVPGSRRSSASTWTTSPGSPMRRPRTRSGCGCSARGSKERWCRSARTPARRSRAYLIRARPALVADGARHPGAAPQRRGGRLSRQSAWTILRTAAERAGITADVSPHTLRHCYATHLLDGGADVRVVQELLGHASVTTTQIYTMVTVDHLREVYRSAHPRAMG